MIRLALAILATCLWAGTAQAQALRSDSPLWTYEAEQPTDLFPQHFIDETSFGCSIPFRLGVYRTTPTDPEENEGFVLIENYGVFHCALVYGESYDQERVANAFEDHAWLVMLEKRSRPGGVTEELFAIQIGVRSGSRYVLLRLRRRETSRELNELDELDWRCPRTAERREARIDIWAQDVCVVASKAQLRQIARAAAARPARARWDLLPSSDTDGTTADSPGP